MLNNKRKCQKTSVVRYLMVRFVAFLTVSKYWRAVQLGAKSVLVIGVRSFPGPCVNGGCLVHRAAFFNFLYSLALWFSMYFWLFNSISWMVTLLINFTYIYIYIVFVLLGKNAYALSILRRVEMKLDGRDVADNRYILPMKILDKYLVLNVNDHVCFYFSSGKSALQNKWIICSNKQQV